MNKESRLYIERKTRDGTFLNDRGPAVFATVSYSKTGKTIYYKGLVLRRPSSNMQKCIYGNYYDVVSGDEFWVTGVKQRGSNRYSWAKGQKVVEEGEL